MRRPTESHGILRNPRRRGGQRLAHTGRLTYESPHHGGDGDSATRVRAGRVVGGAGPRGRPTRRRRHDSGADRPRPRPHSPSAEGGRGSTLVYASCRGGCSSYRTATGAGRRCGRCCPRSDRPSADRRPSAIPPRTAALGLIRFAGLSTALALGTVIALRATHPKDRNSHRPRRTSRTRTATSPFSVRRIGSGAGAARPAATATRGQASRAASLTHGSWPDVGHAAPADMAY